MANGWVDIHGHFTPPTSSQNQEKRYHTMREAMFLVSEPFEWTPESTLAEIDRATHQLHADGFAVTCIYNDVSLGDSSLDPVWAELNRQQAVVFVHPDAYAPASMGRPSPLIEVAFETARTVVDMLYAGVFRKYPQVTFILAHSGGALLVLSGRLKLLGTEPWVPNPNRITQEEIQEQLARLYLDTAATAPTGMAPALHMVSSDHLVYGADCGVPCSTEATMEANKKAVLDYEGLSKSQRDAIGRNVLSLFPAAAARMEKR